MSKVVMYSSPSCPYCTRARQLFSSKGVQFQDINVEGNSELRAEMALRAGARTVPQIWIGETHVGGCDDLYALEYQGKLDVLLA